MECPSNVKINYTKIFINNTWVDAVSGKTFSTINPSTGKKLIDIAEGDQADVDKAVEAAKKAFARGSPWRTTDASGRATLINKLADLIERDSKLLAALESLDNGKPFQDALIDMVIVVMTLRYYAGLADKIHGNTIPADGPVMSMTRKEPVGVVGQIIPWNYPAAMLAWKWGPALATGCTIVMKPAEQTPLSALQICSLVVEAGFPPGVINVVPGYGPTAGAAIASHMEISKVAFTGSTAIGRVVMAAAANSNLKRVSLELGGKSPLVIFDDVDVDEAVNIAYDAIFSNAGQNCCAGSRTFVQDTIYDKFVEKAVAKALTRKVGDAFAANSEQGPQIDDRMFKKVLGLIESGKKQGATLQCGGKQVGTDGYFIAPTIFSDVKDNMDIATDEIFGPVQSILKFKSLDEVIERANKTTYGLAAGVVTKNIDIALQFAQAVQAGSVWVNCYQHITSQTPFGGYKQSGIGRELGVDGLENYLETKTITIKLPTKE